MTKIVTIHAWCDGDPSVGIPGTSATVQADGDWLLDLDDYGDEFDQKEVLEELRLKAARLFYAIWDDGVTVMFDFEIEAERIEYIMSLGDQV